MKTTRTAPLRLPPELFEYLDWEAEQQLSSRAQILRKLVNDAMRASKGYARAKAEAKPAAPAGKPVAKPNPYLDKKRYPNVAVLLDVEHYYRDMEHRPNPAVLNEALRHYGVEPTNP